MNVGASFSNRMGWDKDVLAIELGATLRDVLQDEVRFFQRHIKRLKHRIEEEEIRVYCEISASELTDKLKVAQFLLGQLDQAGTDAL